MDGIVKRVAVAVVLLALLGVAACGDDDHPVPAPPPWAKIAPEQIAEAKKHGVPVAFENTFGMRFVLIPAGTFLMGSPETEWPGPADPEHHKIEQPQHGVTLTQSYYLSIHELTNGQYRKMKPSHKSVSDGDRDLQPVVLVNHAEAGAFAAWLSRRDGEREYRLPTEAEWERSCRGGSSTPFAFGETIRPDQANYCDFLEYGEAKADVWNGSAEYRMKPMPVGRLARNAWGIYDMHGNVAEWCADWFGPYPNEAVTDPIGPPETEAPVLVFVTFGASPRKRSSQARVVRGGAWDSDPSGLRSACRTYEPPDLRVARVGFRLVSPLPEKGG